MATIEDIARIAQVSPATVSRVLNKKNSLIPISQKTIDKITAIAEELNYTPNAFAKALRTQKSNIIGVVVWDLTDPFFSDIIRGVEEVFGGAGYNLLLSSAKESEEQEQRCYEKLLEVRAEGILIVGGPREFKHEDMIKKFNKPVVFVGTKQEFPNSASVVVDNELGGAMGTSYLLKKAYKSYVFFYCKKATKDLEDRRKGIELELSRHSFTESVHMVGVGVGEEASYEAAFGLLQDVEKPSAVFAMNDFSALGIIRAVNDLGFTVPRDIAVLGFDNLSFSQYIEPRLSTIHQPRYTLGEKGAELVGDLIAGKTMVEEERHIVLAPKLIVRSSA